MKTDFENYLAAVAAKNPKARARVRININTPADLFNPQARDGAALWVGLRMVPVAILLACLFTVLA